MNTTLQTRYRHRLENFPQPKQGRHPAILGTANLGIMAGLAPEQIHADIRNAVSGTLPDAEIQAAILKASSDHQAVGFFYRPPPKPAPLIPNGKTALRRIIDQGTISDDVDVWEASPIRLYDAPDRDPVLLLKTLFAPEEFVFIGDRYEDGLVGQNIRSVAAWAVFFSAGGTSGPYIIVNPLSGTPAPKKSGEGDSFRGDGNVKAFRHCLVEFDNLSREDQLLFWSAAKLPILALIDSGGKSIHAWLDVSKLSNVSNSAQWDHEIKIKLYEKIFVPLGVDRACCNPSRLSRLPGYFRDEKGKFQRLLWLAAEGRGVTR